MIPGRTYVPTEVLAPILTSPAHAAREFADVTLKIVGSIQHVCCELMKQLSRLSQSQWPLEPIEELNPQLSFKHCDLRAER